MCGAVLQVTMMVKVPVPLFVLLTSLTGVYPLRLTQIHVKAGELVTLQCPRCKVCNHGVAKLIWTSHTTQEMNLTDSLSSAVQRQMGMLVYGRSLVIFNSSLNHQGNYSCTWRNTSRQSWFRLTVCTNQTREYEESTTYSKTCSEPESCRLNCPAENVPAENIPNITSKGITWHKEGDLLPKAGYFSSVKESDHGVYTCTRSYLYHGQIYNRTFTLELDVTPKKKSEKSPVISSPRMGDVFYVDLGSTVVIDCKADMCSDFDEVFWLSGTSFVKKNNSLPVFYNCTHENNTEKIKATLVFKKVSEEDLSKNYTCKLETDSQPASCVTITLAQRPRPSYLALAHGVVCIVLVMVLTVVVYVKFKIDITLFLRDTLGCNRSTSDGKSYDAFLMCYKSDTEAGLNDYDRQWLMSVLEDRFDYDLCLFDRDVPPGEAFADAVLDCIEQSRTVVLVPTSPDPCLGSGLLSAIHEALVERQTRLVFIKTEATGVSKSSSLPEALRLLVEAGDCVTWKGTRSMQPSSSFWKQLRYHLPAPQRAPKTRILPQTI